MNALLVATNWINVGLAIGIGLSALSIGGHITRHTRCAIRLGVFGIFAGAVLIAGGGWWQFGEWVWTILLAGVLIYLLANLRQPVAVQSDSWSNRAAWIVTCVVLTLLGFTFGGAA